MRRFLNDHKLILAIFFAFYAEFLWAKPVILTIGDSLTFGLGVDSSKNWPSQVEARLKKEGFPDVKVINAGSSGTTGAYGVQALQFHLKRSTPDLVIYALGANDGLRGLETESLYSNMVKVFDELKKRKIKVLLLGMKAPPNYGKSYTDRFEQTFQRIADKYQVPFVPFFLEGVAGERDLNQGDGIHPSALGYERIVKLIYPKIKEQL